MTYASGLKIGTCRPKLNNIISVISTDQISIEPRNLISCSKYWFTLRHANLLNAFFAPFNPRM